MHGPIKERPNPRASGIQADRNTERIVGPHPISGQVAASRAKERLAGGIHHIRTLPRITPIKSDETASGIKRRKLETNVLRLSPAGQNSDNRPA